MGFIKSKDRKKQKYTNILRKNFNIKIVDEPSQVVALCNGGLANGLTQEILLEEFSRFGPIKLAVLPPGQSCSFLEFDCVASAIRAIESSSPVSWIGGGPAFLAYVDRVPDHETSEHLYRMPPGLLVLNDFISEEEENQFLKSLSLETETSTLKLRDVKHFGFEFCYSNNRADSEPIEAIPKEFLVLWPRLFGRTGLKFVPNQCTANKYLPGGGIPPHVDTHSAFTEVIVSLSLQSDVVMEWRKDKITHHVLLPRRSLCVMTGESRYGWTHGIRSRKSDVTLGQAGELILLPRQIRTSITFRLTRDGKCLCNYPELCDTVKLRLKDESTVVSESVAVTFEKTCVHQVYDEIADHFSETRHKPWPNVVKFLNSFSVGEVIVDVGCGNGKYLGCRPDAVLVGCDRSMNLLQLCNSYGYPVFTCDCLHLPLRDCSVDGCISIAVLHHLSTQERRLRGILEILRVLRPGGRALIYVWAKNQEADAKKSSYLKQRKESKSVAEAEATLALAGDVVLPVHTNRTNFTSADMFVPWQKKGSGPTLLRYYHVFEDNELKEVCEGIEHVSCLQYYYDQGNWCIVLKKNYTR